jgi:activator of 2-hydroxyglutaryl-CoA dehydratase
MPTQLAQRACMANTHKKKALHSKCSADSKRQIIKASAKQIRKEHLIAQVLTSCIANWADRKISNVLLSCGNAKSLHLALKNDKNKSKIQR